MKKLLLLGIISVIPLSSYAQKDCTVNLNLRTYLKKVSTAELLDKALEITKTTNIEIVDGDSNYSIEIYASRTTDHHDLRYAYIHGNTEVWPSHHVQDRSAISDDFGTPFMKRRKLKKKRVNRLMNKVLSKELKSCEDIAAKIARSGNGTLDPIDGNTYTTRTGAEFKRIGTYWKAPDGLLWGEVLEHEYTNVGVESPAVKACEELGARLPTAQEYKNLLENFSQSNNRNRTLSVKGQFEFNALFPWSFGVFFTSTRDSEGVGYDFHHRSGSTSEAMGHWSLNIRCVK